MALPEDVLARMETRLAVLDAKERAALEVKGETGERAPLVLQRLPA